MKKTKGGESEAKGKRGRHRTRSEREQMVEAYRASGQTQAVFAHERGIKITTLRAWIYRRQAEDNAVHAVAMSSGDRLPSHHDSGVAPLPATSQLSRLPQPSFIDRLSPRLVA